MLRRLLPPLSLLALVACAEPVDITEDPYIAPDPAGDPGAPEACDGTSPRCGAGTLQAVGQARYAQRLRVPSPLLRGDHDLVSPAMHGDLLVYLSNEDGQRDVWAMHVGTGDRFRVTDTPEDEDSPRVRDTRVVYVRGERAFLFDLETGVERQLSERRADAPALGPNGEIVWSEHDGAQWDLVIEWPTGSGAEPLHRPGGLVGDERAPHLEHGSVSHAVYFSERDGERRPHFSEWPENFAYDMAHDEPMPGAIGPFFNLVGRCWTDGRRVTVAEPDETADWDVYCARLGGPTVALADVMPWAAGPGAQIVESTGTWIGYRDHRNGNWDVGVGLPGGEGELLTTHPANQRGLVSGNDLLVWMDDREGSWDLWAVRRPLPGSGGPLEQPEVQAVEAGPGYVELTLAAWQRGRGDLGGARLLVDGEVRHVFADDARVRSERLVIAEPALRSHFAGADVARPSTGSLGMQTDQVVVSLETREGVELTRAALRADGTTPGW